MGGRGWDAGGWEVSEDYAKSIAFKLKFIGTHLRLFEAHEDDALIKIFYPYLKKHLKGFGSYEKAFCITVSSNSTTFERLVHTSVFCVSGQWRFFKPREAPTCQSGVMLRICSEPKSVSKNPQVSISV